MTCTCLCCCGACCDGATCTLTRPEDCTGTFKGKGEPCEPNPCGCSTDDDCCTTGYYFNDGGTIYGPFDTAAQCASTSYEVCSPFPCICYCEAIDPFCCGGTCQSEPCDPP